MGENIHEGGCLCGAVRFRATDRPFRTGICHCTFCQRRSGSAFGVGVYFKKEDVEFTRGELTSYVHTSDESGRTLTLGFCANCGTTVTWTAELFPDARAIAGGAFDDPRWLKIERHTWTRSARGFVPIPDGVEQHEKGSVSQPTRAG